MPRSCTRSTVLRRRLREAAATYQKSRGVHRAHAPRDQGDGRFRAPARFDRQGARGDCLGQRCPTVLSPPDQESVRVPSCGVTTLNQAGATNPGPTAQIKEIKVDGQVFRQVRSCRQGKGRVAFRLKAYGVRQAFRRHGAPQARGRRYARPGDCRRDAAPQNCAA